MKKNTQARVKSRSGSQDFTYGWESYGEVTHVQAAEKHAYRYPFSYSVIETRWEGHDAVFTHEVLKRIDFVVTPSRGDEK